MTAGVSLFRALVDLRQHGGEQRRGEVVLAVNEFLELLVALLLVLLEHSLQVQVPVQGLHFRNGFLVILPIVLLSAQHMSTSTSRQALS
jgi:hypothetical protein